MNTPLLDFSATLPTSTNKIVSSFTPCSEDDMSYPSPLPAFNPSIILSTPSQYAYLPQSPQSAGSSASRGAPARWAGNQAVLYSPWCPDTPPHGERENAEDLGDGTAWPLLPNFRLGRSCIIETEHTFPVCPAERTLESYLMPQEVRNPLPVNEGNDHEYQHPTHRDDGCVTWMSKAESDSSDDLGSNLERSPPPSEVDSTEFEPRSLSFPAAPHLCSIEMFDDTPLSLDYETDEIHPPHSPEQDWTERQLRSPWLAGDLVGADEFLHGEGMVEREKRLGRSKVMMGGVGMVGLGF